jgi:hypothetical protein
VAARPLGAAVGVFMVFFAITRTGYDELTAALGRIPSPLWLNCDVLSSIEISGLRKNGIEVTPFSVDVTLSAERHEVAVDTISQHHPDESIWSEYRSWPKECVPPSQT